MFTLRTRRVGQSFKSLRRNDDAIAYWILVPILFHTEGNLHLIRLEYYTIIRRFINQSESIISYTIRHQFFEFI